MSGLLFGQQKIALGIVQSDGAAPKAARTAMLFSNKYNALNSDAFHNGGGSECIRSVETGYYSTGKLLASFFYCTGSKSADTSRLSF